MLACDPFLAGLNIAGTRLAKGFQVEVPDQYVAVAALSGPLAWEHSREKASASMAPRTFIYPMEAAQFMELVRTGKQHILPVEYEQIGMVTASVRTARASYPEIRLHNYEEEVQVDPLVAKWVSFAQDRSRGLHTPILAGKFSKRCTPKASHRWNNRG
jgi:hypothetical protein